MGAQLRVYRRRIRSVQSTKKITKAMELIAASRIVKAQARMRDAQPYATELTQALAAVGGDSTLEHPMLTGVANPTRAGIVLITSDRGLAGGYNANAIKHANELADRLQGEGKQVSRYVIGRKGVAFYRFRRIPLAGEWTGFSEQPDFAHVRPVADALVAALGAGTEGADDAEGGAPDGIDELYIVYTRFRNSVSQEATSVLVAPVQGAVEEERAKEAAQHGGEASAETAAANYEFEPESGRLLAALIPRYINARLFSATLESAASESAARRRACKSASDNATELIRTYTRLANQARQAEITQEISEIVGGADALAAAGTDE